MKLVLARHGNTFAPGDPVVRAGSGEDFPLVEKGREQAAAVATALHVSGMVPDRIYSSPLRRTTEFAAIIADKLSLKLEPRIRSELNELDYGEWAGLTDDEIKQRGYGEELDAWNDASVWPRSSGWPETEQEVQSAITSFASELVFEEDRKTVLVVSSNGRLRYFLRLIEGLFESACLDGSFKMGTGRLSLLEHDAGLWRLHFWNVLPRELIATSFTLR